jgi:hypothetical protein
VERWAHTQSEIAMLAWGGFAKLASPTGALELWTSTTRRSVEAGMVLAEAMAQVGGSLFRASLDPFHRAVTANAKRLSGS